MKYLVVLSLFILTACGADGLPTRPDKADPNIRITSTTQVGIAG